MTNDFSCQTEAAKLVSPTGLKGPFTPGVPPRALGLVRAGIPLGEGRKADVKNRARPRQGNFANRALIFKPLGASSRLAATARGTCPGGRSGEEKGLHRGRSSRRHEQADTRSGFSSHPGLPLCPHSTQACPRSPLGTPTWHSKLLTPSRPPTGRSSGKTRGQKQSRANLLVNPP